jgi:hypothetical protein
MTGLGRATRGGVRYLRRLLRVPKPATVGQ